MQTSRSHALWSTAKSATIVWRTTRSVPPQHTPLYTHTWRCHRRVLLYTPLEYLRLLGLFFFWSVAFLLTIKSKHDETIWGPKRSLINSVLFKEPRWTNRCATSILNASGWPHKTCRAASWRHSRTPTNVTFFFLWIYRGQRVECAGQLPRIWCSSPMDGDELIKSLLNLTNGASIYTARLYINLIH